MNLDSSIGQSGEHLGGMPDVIAEAMEVDQLGFRRSGGLDEINETFSGIMYMHIFVSSTFQILA